MPPKRKPYVPSVVDRMEQEEKLLKRKQIGIPSEGKGPGWIVAIILLIIGLAAGIAIEHFVKVLDMVLGKQ